MKLGLLTTAHPSPPASSPSTPFPALLPRTLTISHQASNSQFKPLRLITACSHSTLPNSSISSPQTEEKLPAAESSEPPAQWKVQVASPGVPSFVPPAKMSSSDQAFFLLAFIACTTSVAFTSLVIAAVPALYAMGRAAISLSKLADTAREELPSTMAAIRLSGMEISDLTLELSDLSQEITDGVTKSAQAVQAAEAGIRQIGSLAPMIQERASLPIISLQPAVAGAAKKTSRAVGQATKRLISIISQGEYGSENKGDNLGDKLET
ncbi:hypothetical protein RJ639_030767 [Escallonia herrerae]|uniref:Uncharacterized protein n=1 Tax=Escallonia herrerae TaxID=1293975 RepID=A0AA88X1Q9_9ASTE|nr:hypothetical protein RJ639_030767 [Escallonia herrerae]